jgi:ectoine hydroxylase-related dioxygenase (phytanoyl-CoA dioxygenase family)
MTEERREFEQQGYAVIRGLLSPEESAHYRAEIQKLSGVRDADFGQKVFTCADGVTQNPPFWPLIYNERLLETIRTLIGPTARYTQHSDLHAHVAAPPPGPTSAGGWHRDSACREFNVGPDWDESHAPYQIVRVAIYLQTYAESHSALGVVPGSHRYEEKLTGNARRLWSRLLNAEYRFKRALWRMGLGEEPYYYHPWFHHRTRPTRWPLLTRPTDPVWIRTEPGDCIIFNQRLYHSASPITGPKYALYLSYAADNEHARNHMRYYRFLRKDLNYGPIPPELADQLREHDLYMEVPDPANIEGATVNWGHSDYLADLKAPAR